MSFNIEILNTNLNRQIQYAYVFLNISTYVCMCVNVFVSEYHTNNKNSFILLFLLRDVCLIAIIAGVDPFVVYITILTVKHDTAFLSPF